ncbi:polysaccharide deacetylase family protein [Rubrivirga sp. IMCC43871]|uniref:polysaccharide deacetylase family protein n=1 Tax=Rubrivirga sp. IMCC43871 TaxID=3391575 RepID=UPI00398F9CB9
MARATRVRWLRTAGLAVVLGLAILVGGWRLSKSRHYQLFGGLVTRVETDQRVVALTFDDGPTPAGTDTVLPLLDSLGVRATFFVTGREMAAHPDEGRRLVDAGHALGNHSYSHRHMVFHTPGFVRRELEATDARIRAAGWEGDIAFRPPYGRRLAVLPWILRQAGRETLLWDVEPESFPAVAADPERIAEHVAARVRPGSIVLLHVMVASRATSREAVPLVVERLRAEGYRFVTVPELLALRAP